MTYHDREELRKKTMKESVGYDKMRRSIDDPEFAKIRDRLIYGETYHEVKISKEIIQEVTLAALATLGCNPSIMREHVVAALKTDLNAENIREVIYQCAPYSGIARVEQALDYVNEVFSDKLLNQVIPPMATTNEDNRFEKGKEIQTRIFGDAIATLHNNAVPDNAHITVKHLSAYCFGDIYTRNGLSLQERELITFACLCALGGVEPQLKAHVQGNIAVGNTRQDLIDVLTIIMPYIGFPRTLNALNVVNQF